MLLRTSHPSPHPLFEVGRVGRRSSMTRSDDEVGLGAQCLLSSLGEKI